MLKRPNVSLLFDMFALKIFLQLLRVMHFIKILVKTLLEAVKNAATLNHALHTIYIHICRNINKYRYLY